MAYTCNSKKLGLEENEKMDILEIVDHGHQRWAIAIDHSSISKAI